MIELTINVPITLVVSGTGSLTDTLLYKDGVASGVTPTVVQIGATNCWRVTFTPLATGTYALYGFGVVQARAQCRSKSLYDSLTNIEDEALGSWTWNKETGVLTLLRQSGSALASFNVVDTLTVASRERVS